MKMRLRKSTRLKTITGTLGGIADHIGIDYSWLRLIFIVTAILTKGLVVPLYFVAALIMPSDRPKRRFSLRPAISIFRSLFIDVYQIVVRSRYAKIFGMVFIVFGLIIADRPMGLLTGALLIVGTTLLFNPFNLSEFREPASESEEWRGQYWPIPPAKLPEA